MVCGIGKVGGEMGLLTWCYNFKRVLKILGFERFIAYCRQRGAMLPLFLRRLYWGFDLPNRFDWFCLSVSFKIQAVAKLSQYEAGA